MAQFLTQIGRKVAVINLDPANEKLPYECALDINDLVSLEKVMGSTDLGPNGGPIHESFFFPATCISSLFLFLFLSSPPPHTLLLPFPSTYAILQNFFASKGKTFFVE